MRRIGLVGTGLMGDHHHWALDALAKAGLIDAAVTVVWDTDPERVAAFAAARALPVADSIQDLVDQVDVVWVCTWTAGHLEPCLLASRAGRAVFVEKPLAPTLPECEELATVLRSVPHQVGLILRHAPAYRRLADLVSSGDYGRPMGALFRDDQKLPLGEPYFSSWRSDVTKAGGGTLIEHSVHDVDVLTWLLGPPSSVTAQTTSFAGHPGIEDLASVQLRFPEGHSASLLSVWHQVAGRTTARRLEVFCERAVLWMEGEVGPIHVQTSDGTTEHVVPLPAVLDPLPLQDVPETWRDAAAGLALQALAFLSSLDSGTTGFPSVDTALVAHRVVDAAYRSARQGGAPRVCG